MSALRIVLAGVAAAFVVVPAASPRPDPGPVVSGPPGVRSVAITFDDGPVPRTHEVIVRLQRAGARATFFQLGVNVERHPQLARRAASVGEVANHSYGHPDLVRLSSAAIRQELLRASRAIGRATGVRPALFRPPYGSRDARVDAVARELGMRQILWSVDTEDWRDPSADRLIERIRRQLRPGGIVLFHDHGRATLTALDWLLRELDRRRLRAVTVSELLAGAGGRGTTRAGSGISVVAWDGRRLGAIVWRGGPASLRQTRFLRGARQPTLSPSGASVAFVRYARGGFDVYRTGTEAGVEAKLAEVEGTRATSLAFAPDGRTLAFASPKGIELVSVVPGGPRRALGLPARWRGSTYSELAFSPDGRLLAFSRTWGDGRAGTLRNELAVIGRDGTGARTLVPNPDPYSYRYAPVFSPDGARIAFGAADGSLSTVPVVGGRVLMLTTPRRDRSARTDSRPLYSPDGGWIAFTRSPGRGGSDVFLVRPDGTGLKPLTSTPLPEPGRPRTGSSALAWSPDGTRLLAFRHDTFAVVDVATRASTAIGRGDPGYGVQPALWH